MTPQCLKVTCHKKLKKKINSKFILCRKLSIFERKYACFFQNSDQNRQFLSKVSRFQMKQAPLNPRIKFFRNFRLKNFLEKISWFKLSRNNAEQAEHVSKNKPDDRFNHRCWGEWFKISTFWLKISTKAPKTPYKVRLEPFEPILSE